MKKHLPTSTTLLVNTSKGFTLVELLVVMSVIAILAVAGLVLFSGTQKSARDTVRRQEIDSIAKAMEMNYDNATNKYTVLTNISFANGVPPADIYTGTVKCGNNGTNDGTFLCEYCGRTAAGTAMTKGQNTATGCPTGGTKVDLDTPAPDTAFEVCATLEKSPYFYCKSSQR